MTLNARRWAVVSGSWSVKEAKLFRVFGEGSLRVLRGHWAARF
jgi:hypothetical protein